MNKKMAFVAIILVMGIVSANGGFGEYSGQIVRNIPIGTSQVDYWTLVNYYNYSLTFYIIPQYFGNATGAPKVSYSAIGCTPTSLCAIPANGTYQINVTISVPSNATLNTTWSGYATAFVPPASNNTASEQIEQGTAKLLSITVVPKPITTTILTTSVAPILLITSNKSTSISSVVGTTVSKNNGYLGYLEFGLILVVVFILGTMAGHYLAQKKTNKIEKPTNTRKITKGKIKRRKPSKTKRSKSKNKAKKRRASR